MLQCKLYQGNIFLAGEASGDDNDNVLPKFKLLPGKMTCLLTNVKCTLAPHNLNTQLKIMTTILTCHFLTNDLSLSVVMSMP